RPGAHGARRSVGRFPPLHPLGSTVPGGVFMSRWRDPHRRSSLKQKLPSGPDPQRRSVTTIRSPFQRPQHWHPAFTGSGRGPVGPFGLSRLWLLPAPSRGLAHQARATVRRPRGAPLGVPATQFAHSGHSWGRLMIPAMALRDGVVVGAPGSAGVFGTRFVDLPEPLRLDCGRSLEQVRIAYEAYGRLSPAKDNVVLVCHALSGDAHAAGWSDEPEAPSAVDGFGADDRGIKPRGGL